MVDLFFPEALKRANVHADELDVIIVGTVTPDMSFPSTACLVQKELCANNAYGFDISAGCASFIFSLTTATQMIESGRYKKILIIGSEVMSSIINYKDRNTCVLFGDGAGAVLVEPCPEENHGVLDFLQRVDGNGENYLYMKAGGSRFPASIKTVTNIEHYVKMNGKEVFKAAIKQIKDVTKRLIKKNELDINDISLFIFHQANIRIIKSCISQLGIDASKAIVNIEKYGNTSSASIPLSLYDAKIKNDKISKGDLILIASFGAGFSWGSVLMRWFE